MRITIITVGKIKERWIKDGAADYLKRLRRFAKIQIREIPEEKVNVKSSEKERIQATEREGEKILKNLPSEAWTIAMDSRGQTVGSEGLAGIFSKQTASGTSHFVLITGGSNGLSGRVIRRCRMSVSFGPNTFPRQLFFVMLLEQIYRAGKIMAGETYHK